MPLVEGTVVEQQIILQDGAFDFIELLVGGSGGTNASVIAVTLSNDAGEILYEDMSDSAFWKDNDWLRLSFPKPLTVSAGTYTIRFVSLSGDETNSPTFMVNIGGDGAIPTLLFDGVSTSNSLQIRVGSIASGTVIVYVSAWVLLIVLSYVFALFAGGADERTFLLFSLCLGSLFIVFTGFPHLVDEHTHFVKTLSIAVSGDIGSSEVFVDGNIGFQIPGNMVYPIFNVSSDLSSFSQAVGEEDVFLRMPYLASVIPVNHVIMSIGLFIAQFFGFSVAGTVYFGRLWIYMIYVTVCYFAIAKAKYYKPVFFFVAMIPTSQWISASYSTDPILISSALLCTSICMNYILSDRETISHVKNTDLLALLYCVLTVGAIKYCGYMPLFLLFFLIPRRSFTNRQYGTSLFVGIGVIALYLFWQVRLLKTFPYVEDRVADTDVKEQIKYMLHNPLHTIRICVDYVQQSLFSHITNLSSWHTSQPTVGNLFSVSAVFAALLCRDKYEFGDVAGRRRFVIWLLSIFAVMSVLNIFALYLAWTPVGAPYISGIQTRYFFPQLPLLFIAASTMRIKSDSDRFSPSFAFLMALWLLLGLTGNLLQSFTA